MFHHEKQLEHLDLKMKGWRPNRSEVAHPSGGGGAPPALFSPPIVRFASILREPISFDLKTIYIYNPQVLQGERLRNTETRKTEAASAKIGGGNSTGATAGGISTFSNVFLINTMIKGE
jgi:hypothetical protein